MAVIAAPHHASIQVFGSPVLWQLQQIFRTNDKCTPGWAVHGNTSWAMTTPNEYPGAQLCHHRD